MGGTAFRALACFALLVSIATGQPGASDKKTAPTVPLALPPGTIVAIVEKAEDALKLIPSGVILGPEKFKALKEAAERLQALSETPTYQPPSKCHLKGHIEGGLLVLTVTYEFDIRQPGTLIWLACGQGLATAVTLEGRSPALLANVRPDKTSEQGFALRADRTGQQTLTLELMVPLTARPGGQGFSLDLPRAAITTFDVDLPEGSREPRVGGKPPEGGTKLKGRNLSGPLGPLDRLDLSWRSPATAAATAVTAAEGEILIKVGQRETTCESTLTLRVLGGQVKEWRLLVPVDAELTTDMERVERIDTDKKIPSLRILRLKEPAAESLAVTVRSSIPTPRSGGGKAALGPFSVVGAVRQTGSVLISNSVLDWHLEWTPHGDLSRRGLTEEELRRDPSLVAAFRYGPSGAAGPVWLEFESEQVQGQIKVRPSHVLRLVEDDEGPYWRVETTALVTPRWADLGRLVFVLPPNCEWEPEPDHVAGSRVRSATFDPSNRQVEFRLKRTGEPGNAPFTVRVVGRYPAMVPLTGDTTLALPRSTGSLDQEGSVSIEVPSNLELLHVDNPPPLELIRQGPHALNYRFTRRHAPNIALAWRPYRAPVEVHGLVSLTLGPGEGQVTHELSYRFPAADAPRELRLALPEAIATSVKVIKGPASVQGRLLRFAPTPDGKLVLTYSFPLPAEGPVEVPLAEPEGASRIETKVLVWSDTDRLPTLDAEGWAESPIENVPGKPWLPVLVARSTTSDRPLRFQFMQKGTGLPALISRALIRVTIGETTEQTYRASFLIERLATTAIEFEMPGHAVAINLEATLDGKRLQVETLPADPAQRGRLVRLRVSPQVVRNPAVLELTYDLPPGAGSVFGMPLLAPKIVDGPPGLPVRWMVYAPSAWVVLGPDPGGTMPRHWTRLGWIFAPQCAQSASEIEHWLLGSKGFPPEEDGLAEGPTLVLWNNGSGDVSLLWMSRQTWLLCCSLLVFLAGTTLGWLASRELSITWAWGGGLLLLFLGIIIATGFPYLAAQVVYGCQPGLAVLALLGLGLWAMHERRRRQMVFLPSFTRAKTGSSLSQPEPSATARSGPEQPSTVDAPRSSGSVERLGG